jgi:hypothetical protein
LNGSDVIPDACEARDRESRANPAFLDWLWIPGQAFSLPGMTRSKRRIKLIFYRATESRDYHSRHAPRRPPPVVIEGREMKA